MEQSWLWMNGTVKGTERSRERNGLGQKKRPSLEQACANFDDIQRTSVIFLKFFKKHFLNQISEK
jgi:hypothetical protein